MRLNSRLLMSEDAIAEFRVNSALFTAESGGSMRRAGRSGVEIGLERVPRFGVRVRARRRLRCAALHRSGALPPFQFHQFGGSVGGADLKNRTFFFLSYEGLRQTPESAGRGPERSVPGVSRPGAAAVARDQAAARLPSRTPSAPPRTPTSAIWRGTCRICRTKTSGRCGWITASTTAGRATSVSLATTHSPASRWRSITATAASTRRSTASSNCST